MKKSKISLVILGLVLAFLYIPIVLVVVYGFIPNGITMSFFDSNGAFIGFTIAYPHEPFTWFWYFAVREELRGRGKGQEILSSLLRKYEGRTCILDMESPRQECANHGQRMRRHGFYLRNGFADTNVYRTYEGIEYTIMMKGEGTFTMRDYDAIIRDLRRFWQPGMAG